MGKLRPILVKPCAQGHRAGGPAHPLPSSAYAQDGDATAAGQEPRAVPPGGSAKEGRCSESVALPRIL